MLRYRTLFAAIFVIAIVANISAGDKRPTGTVNSDIYRDNQSGFTFKKFGNWKFGKIDNEDPARPRLLRTIITQKTVAYPADYIGNEDKFTMPVIAIFVDTTAMVLEAYAAEFADHKSKRPSRKEAARDFPILSKASFGEQGSATLDGQKAILMHFRQNYEVQLYNRIKDQYALKEDAILGDLYLTKRGNSVYLFSFTCEREIYRTVNEEAKTIIMSVDFDPPADSTLGAVPGASGE